MVKQIIHQQKYISILTASIAYLIYGVISGPKNEGNYILNGNKLFIDRNEFYVLLVVGCLFSSFAIWILTKASLTLSQIEQGISFKRIQLFILPALINIIGTLIYVLLENDNYDILFWLVASSPYLLTSLWTANRLRKLCSL
ncbi:hypothetical protein [Xanthocytophaga flava]|uniref:hypothetical protein n=1 Tax=Xanthocytophaga flava TaxID=3048013 RepID=UPI0028D4E074|nr:hypothetical protein [Xanthocytophaga flavus]MDJ1473477.1 hypothetical protein [Xanthocytophaga flavus]